MDSGAWTAAAGVLVAAIGGLFAWLAQKAASRASVLNNTASLEAQKLTQAFERADEFNVKTIHRQDAELDEVRLELTGVKKDNADLHDELRLVRTELRGVKAENLELRKEINTLRQERGIGT